MDLLTSAACGPPPTAAVYNDIATVSASLQAHAKAHRYALIVRSTYPNKASPTRVIYACDRQGRTQSKSQNPDIHPQRHQKGARSKRYSCRIQVVLKKDPKSSLWELEVLEGSHNHTASADPSAHPTHRIAALDPSIIV